MDLDFQSPTSPKQSALEVLLLIALVLAGFAVAQGLGAAITTAIAGIGVSIPQEFTLPVSTLISGAAFVIVSLAYLQFNSELNILNLSLPSAEDLGWAILGFLAVFMAAISIGALVEFFGIQSASNEVQSIASETPVTFLYMIPLAFISIGVSEEILFRGVIQRKLVPHFGVGGGLVAASLLFGAAHVFALQSSSIAALLVTMTILSLLGLIMGLAYEKTDNLMVPILIHGAYDAVLFAISYVVVTTGGVM